ncbi:type III PLP-dependent enzyme [Duganella radicis]|uniref:Type III PLP-dependent enzyme n=1 Tax=Duganella radicis TaxID=551988 RepID=A0A6L6PCX5_9BURK|nr:type III PLP-dependent enzyme [Duganella radicis]MTV36743.1 type III PLP-dependent enzyme [Duganella radicis]
MTALPELVARHARALAATATDPVSAFIYDLPALRRHVQWLKSLLPPGVELYYAIKANSEAPVLEALAPWVDGFEISSGGEIARALQSGPRRNFIFSGPGKLDSDLRQALRHNVEMIHVESLDEIRRLNAIASELQKRQPVLIRINPSLPAHLATKLSMAGAPTPFGIDEAQLPQAVALVEACPHLALHGFHVHAMSHQLDVERHIQLLDWYLERWPSWQALASDRQTVRWLNAGGGMGVNYLLPQQFDWARLCRHLAARLSSNPQAPRIRFEPGRLVTAFCGYYLMQVLDLKHSHGKNFAVCRGGTHQFRLPSAQGHDHPVLHLPAAHAAATPAAWTVVGQLCTPKDVLSRDAVLSGLAIGDLLVLPLAGAYGYNISHADFLCHPRPQQIFIDAEPSQTTPSRSESHAAHANP